MSKYKVGDRVKVRYTVPGISPIDHPMRNEVVTEILEPDVDTPVDHYRIELGGTFHYVKAAEVVPSETTAIKADGDKPILALIPGEAIMEMGKAMTFGAKKYSPDNYKNGMPVSRSLSAALRHLFQHLDGETIDEETQVMHLGCAMASIAMAIYTMKNKPELDDRFKPDVEKKSK